MIEPSHRRRVSRLLAGSAAFMIGSGAIIWGVWTLYLMPAYRAWRDASPEQRQLLSASSMLLLALVLLTLLLLLLSAFGVRWLFWRRYLSDAERTSPFDAWAESARRTPNPPDDRK